MAWYQIIKKCYASSHRQGFSLIPDTPLLFFSTSFVLSLLSFLFTFQPHSLGLSWYFEWGKEGREGECSQFRCILPWLELLFSGSEYDTLLQIFFKTRFCCYLLGKDRGDGANEGSMPSSPLPLWRLGSTNKSANWSN